MTNDRTIDTDNAERGYCSTHNDYFTECDCLEKEMAQAANESQPLTDTELDAIEARINTEWPCCVL